MTEADLLYHFILVREQLDATIAQTVGLTLAVFVGIYYFLHKVGWKLKLAVFVMYCIGWYTFIISGGLASQQLIGILADLNSLIENGQASEATKQVVSSMATNTSLSWVIVVNIGNYLLLFAVAGFLFFWKPATGVSADEVSEEVADVEED